MRTFHGRLSAIGAGALLLSLCNQTHALARASQAGHDDPWSSEGIDRLPTEVRNAVIRMCGHSLHAAHYFATYVDNSRLIKLHFELLHCDEQAIFCKGDSCLQQTYVAIRGHYRLMKSYYGRSNN